jgi:hypothetical protein
VVWKSFNTFRKYRWKTKKKSWQPGWDFDIAWNEDFLLLLDCVYHFQWPSCFLAHSGADLESAA